MLYIILMTFDFIFGIRFPRVTTTMRLIFAGLYNLNLRILNLTLDCRTDSGSYVKGLFTKDVFRGGEG
jgi:hypothetical protein